MGDSKSNDEYVLPSSDSESARLELQAELYGGADFDRDLVERARTELEDAGPRQSLLELTVVASGRK